MGEVVTEPTNPYRRAINNCHCDVRSAEAILPVLECRAITSRSLPLEPKRATQSESGAVSAARCAYVGRRMVGYAELSPTYVIRLIVVLYHLCDGSLQVVRVFHE